MFAGTQTRGPAVGQHSKPFYNGTNRGSHVQWSGKTVQPVQALSPNLIKAFKSAMNQNVLKATFTLVSGCVTLFRQKTDEIIKLPGTFAWRISEKHGKVPVNQKYACAQLNQWLAKEKSQGCDDTVLKCAKYGVEVIINYIRVGKDIGTNPVIQYIRGAHGTFETPRISGYKVDPHQSRLFNIAAIKTAKMLFASQPNAKYVDWEKAAQQVHKVNLEYFKKTGQEETIKVS